MQAKPIVRSDRSNKQDKLTTAYEHLEEVLETVDLTNDRALADAVLEAVKATDRAKQIASDR